MPSVTVTRTITFHLTDAGRDSMRNHADRMDQLAEMYKGMDATAIAASMSDAGDLMRLIADGDQPDYLLDVAEGIHGYVPNKGTPPGEES